MTAPRKPDFDAHAKECTDPAETAAKLAQMYNAGRRSYGLQWVDHCAKIRLLVLKLADLLADEGDRSRAQMLRETLHQIDEEEP